MASTAPSSAFRLPYYVHSPATPPTTTTDASSCATRLKGDAILVPLLTARGRCRTRLDPCSPAKHLSHARGQTLHVLKSQDKYLHASGAGMNRRRYESAPGTLHRPQGWPASWAKQTPWERPDNASCDLAPRPLGQQHHAAKCGVHRRGGCPLNQRRHSAKHQPLPSIRKRIGAVASSAGYASSERRVRRITARELTSRPCAQTACVAVAKRCHGHL